MKILLTHMVAIRKARHQAEAARPAITDHDFWNNDYTDDMIDIVRDPSFMNKGGFFTFALTNEDRELIVSYLLRCQEIEKEDKETRARLAA